MDTGKVFLRWREWLLQLQEPKLQAPQIKEATNQQPR